MNNFQFNKYIKPILSKIIPKDIIEYVINNYINTLRNLSLCFKKNMNKYVPKIVRLAKPLIKNKYNELHLTGVYGEIFNEKYICVVGTVEIEGTKQNFSIFYNYIDKRIINIHYYKYYKIRHLRSLQIYDDKCLYFDRYASHGKGNYELYNILSNEAKHYVCTPDTPALHIFYKQFICHRVDHVCLHCISLGIDRSNKSCQCADMIVVDTLSSKIYRVTIDPIYEKYFDPDYANSIYLTDKYIYQYNHKHPSIFVHDYINNITKEYKIPNNLKGNFLFLRNEIIYYNRNNKIIDLYRLDNFKCVHSIYFDDKIYEVSFINDFMEIDFYCSKKTFVYKIN